MLKPERMHLQFSQFAEEYGPVFKISIFNQTIVVLNSAEICLEALTRKGRTELACVIRGDEIK